MSGSSWSSASGRLLGIAILVAVYAEVSLAPTSSSLALGVGTIVLSWTFVHVMFSLHYAHEYYDPDRGDPPGLRFPGKDPAPDYLDFFDVALVIGMSAQVSDVMVTGARVRRTVLVQGGDRVLVQRRSARAAHQHRRRRNPRPNAAVPAARRPGSQPPCNSARKFIALGVRALFADPPTGHKLPS